MSSRIPADRSKSRGAIEPLLASSIRCHALGSLLSLVLLLAIAWIWTNADTFAKDERYTPKQIEQAIRLVSEADSLRNQYADCLLLSKQNDRRRDAIERWLPPSIDWEKTNQHLGMIARQVQVELMSIDKGETQTGRRIGVQQVTCEIRGSYANLCRFLHRVGSDRTPFWCDSVRIQRAPPGVDEAVECAASLSLRLPLVAEGTIAAKLLQEAVPDAT